MMLVNTIEVSEAPVECPTSLAKVSGAGGAWTSCCTKGVSQFHRPSVARG